MSDVDKILDRATALLSNGDAEAATRLLDANIDALLGPARPATHLTEESLEGVGDLELALLAGGDCGS